MKYEIEHNALLLQVMAHDLLAPLTATKWQAELLNKENIAPAKRISYLQGIADSTALGITLTKHAHVAGQVLVGSYAKQDEQVLLPKLIREATHALRLQYERHGLDIIVDAADESKERVLDRELVSLMIWCLAKFFLTCTPANATVTVRGVQGEDETGAPLYTLIMSAPNVPEPDTLVRLFTSVEARDPYDQTYVFVKLIHAIAPMLGATAVATTPSNLLALELTFGAPTE